MSETRDKQPRRGSRRGLGTALAAVLFLVLLAGMRYEWWEYPSPEDTLLDFATVWLALFGLVATGSVWAVRLYKYWTRHRRLTWASALTPLLVLTTAAAFELVDLPVHRDFDRAHGQMEELARTMLRDGNSRLASTEIDGVQFSVIYVGEDNCVYFVDGKRSDVISRHGWMYTAQCAPDKNTLRSLDSPADNWLAYEQGS
ncbi:MULTISPECIES: hypothetical protein [unclassified Rhodococcus (in: high G+C Gram-positive bacteria)]|uniref:hypothetical protein n=1 Tax=unclassified Rhodococcus (in: high G+C Gram-positive bacteria) TaxID=192944 RepID=UPI00109D96DA|nr:MULTISPECIES: hypothetical protein [unclassified Rhodococcus (in: high G+C Gram-positive bacteria)]QCB50352.1 hypothetical protein E5769_08990 [Rhodococcus sp. PAMC28705]QCB57956.1 hypothetical protein E5720_05025 [Rhodococcus sp. PAMC28707]